MRNALPSLYFSTTHFPLSADSDEKFGRRLRRPISSWITPLFFHALVKRFHNTHVSFSKRSLKGRGRKTRRHQLYRSIFNFTIPFFFSRESARSELSISMRCKLVSSGYVYAGIFRLDAAWLAPLTEKIMRRRPPSFPWSRASVPRRDTDGRISKGTRAFHEVYGSIVQTFSFPPFYNSNESWLERV